MKDFLVRTATKEDIGAIQGLLYPHYFQESGYGHLTYNAENTRKAIESYFDDGAVLLATKGGDAIGVCAVHAFKSFYDEIEVDVQMFFVKKEHRGGGVSREMVRYVIDSAEHIGAKIIYSSCLSGMGGKVNALWQNLWGKFGFKFLGSVMVRS